MIPTLVVHADWSTAQHKRWLAKAVWNDNRYEACATEPVEDPKTLLTQLAATAGPDGCVLLGFDFPIGLPLAYARRAHIDNFLGWLPNFGQGDWPEFYAVAEWPDQISLRRPFYPQRPGASKRQHLVDKLGLTGFDDLRRKCELAHLGRRAASPLFWTLGGQQVGKAAIVGWQQLLAPALRDETFDLALWPFSGALFDLVKPGRLIVAETYPTEYYEHLGIAFRPSQQGQRTGKRVQTCRADNQQTILNWATEAGVVLASTLRAEIGAGFGSAANGEDRFDAAVGLFGMLNVLLGHRRLDEPTEPATRRVEGWILGQSTDWLIAHNKEKQDV